MPMWNETAYINATNMTGVFSYANDVTGGMFMNISVFIIFLATFIIVRKWGEKDAFAVSSFVTVMLSLILRATSLIGDWVVILFFFLTGISLFLQTRGN